MIPELGSTFSFPFGDSLYGAFRIIQSNRKELLTAITQFVATVPPDISDPKLKTIMVLSYNPSQDPGRPLPKELEKRLALQWVLKVDAPQSFKLIGLIRPTEEEKSLTGSTYGSFEGLSEIIIRQYLWDTDRDEYMSFVLKRGRESVARQLELEKHRASKLSMKKMLKTKFFKCWTGTAPVEVINICRNIMTETVASVESLRNQDASKTEILSLLHSCAARLSKQSHLHGDFIETFERDEAVRMLDDLCSLSGIEEGQSFSRYFS